MHSSIYMSIDTFTYECKNTFLIHTLVQWFEDNLNLMGSQLVE